MDRGDVYFMEYLHLMFNKPNLLRNRDENPFVDDMTLKETKIEELEEKEIEILIERLRQMFTSFSGGSISTGMTLEQVKQRIREKIRNIKPRE